MRGSQGAEGCCGACEGGRDDNILREHPVNRITYICILEISTIHTERTALDELRSKIGYPKGNDSFDVQCIPLVYVLGREQASEESSGTETKGNTDTTKHQCLYGMLMRLEIRLKRVVKESWLTMEWEEVQKSGRA